MDMEAEEDQSAQVQGQPGRSRRWSGVYKHFDCFRDGDGNDKARCKRCQLVLGASTRNGTSTLMNHVRICWGPEAAAAASRRAPRPPVPGSSSRGSSRGHRETDGLPADKSASSSADDLARMIALRGYDPSFVEDDYFRSFVRRLNPQFKLPSRDDIEDMCCDIFDSHMDDMFQSCDEAPGRISLAVGIRRISLAVGIAKTMEALEAQVLCTTCQYIDYGWNLHKAIVRAYVVLPPGDRDHGVPSAVGFPRGAGSYFFGTSAGSLDDVAECVGSYISEYEDSKYTLFIMARGVTGDIDYGDLKDRIEKELWWSNSPPANREVICITYMDHVLHSIARCLLPGPDFQKDIMLSAAICLQGIFEVRRQCARHGLDDPWEYWEHWYWCYSSLEILHKWGEIHTGSEELLHSLWKVIHHAIKTVSDSSRPTSNLCLEQLFKVRYALKSQLSKATALPGEYRGFGTKNVADVLEEALDTVDKAIQDSYLVWSIPYVLDPRYKLRSLVDNFKRAFGSEDAECYTSRVRGKLKEMYTNYIKNDNGMEEDETELDHYLQDSPARQPKDDFDILIWWKVHGSDQYPRVAQMARDALAMPTCSKLTSDQIAHVRSMLRGY